VEVCFRLFEMARWQVKDFALVELANERGEKL